MHLRHVLVAGLLGLVGCHPHTLVGERLAVPSPVITVSPSARPAPSPAVTPDCAYQHVVVGGKYLSACTIPLRQYTQRACRADELSFDVSFSGGGLTDGGAEAGLELKTVGNEACTVAGVPRLVIWDKTGRQVTNTRLYETDFANALIVRPGPVLLLPNSSGPHGRAVSIAEFNTTHGFINQDGHAGGCTLATPISAVQLSIPGIGFMQRVTRMRRSDAGGVGLDSCDPGYALTTFQPEDAPHSV